jgi:cellulose synthase (UDP-forming)
MVVESEPVMSPRDRQRFVLLSALGAAAIGNFLIQWFTGWRNVHVPLFLAGSALLLFYVMNQQGRWFLLPSMRKPCHMAAAGGLRVAVVTTYVPGSESLELIELALRALTNIRYPHDTWLLDEGNDPAARALCDRLGVRHFSRKAMTQYQAHGGVFRSATKYGNYNAWLHEIGYGSYDILSAFDADHVPHNDYLHQVLGYFRDARVGYVQPAQAYYNQHATLISRGAAEDTYAYFSMVQMASFGMGYPIVVGGHNVHRVSALEAVGGFAAHDADDLLITLRYRNAGWHGVYVPRILARGLTPVDWLTYLRQQRRWARSIIDIKVRQWRDESARLSRKARVVSLMQGFAFIFRGVVGLLVYLIVAGLLFSAETPARITTVLVASLLVMLIAISLQEAFRQKFYLDPETERGFHWRPTVLWYAKWPWLLLALMDVLWHRRLGYVLTSKVAQHGRYWPFVVTHIVLALGLLLAWSVGRSLGRDAAAFALAGAALFMLASLLLAWTGLRAFPPPFDARLWRSIADPPTA